MLRCAPRVSLDDTLGSVPEADVPDVHVDKSAVLIEAYSAEFEATRPLVKQVDMDSWKAEVDRMSECVLAVPGNLSAFFAKTQIVFWITKSGHDVHSSNFELLCRL